MRSKAKYLAIVAVLLVAVLAVALVACGSAKPTEVIANTNDWLASAKGAKVTDEVTIKNFSVEVPGSLVATGGLVSLSSMKVKSTREITGDKFKITLEVSDIKGLKLSDTLNGFVTGIANLANASQISIKLELTYDPTSENIIVGEFHGYKLGAVISSLPMEDTNPDKEQFFVTKEAVTGVDHPKEEALVGAIMDLLDNTIMGKADIKDGTESVYASGTANLANILGIAQLALEKYGNDFIWKYDPATDTNTETEYTANKIVAMIFGEGFDLEEIFSDVLKFTTFDLTDVKTQKVNGKEVLASATLKNTDAYNVELSAATVLNIKNNLNTILGAFGVNEPLIGQIAGIVLSGKINAVIKNISIVSTYETI